MTAARSRRRSGSEVGAGADDSSEDTRETLSCRTRTSNLQHRPVTPRQARCPVHQLHACVDPIVPLPNRSRGATSTCERTRRRSRTECNPLAGARGKDASEIQISFAPSCLAVAVVVAVHLARRVPTAPNPQFGGVPIAATTFTGPRFASSRRSRSLAARHCARPARMPSAMPAASGVPRCSPAGP